jgi:hypothetical protein
MRASLGMQAFPKLTCPMPHRPHRWPHCPTVGPSRVTPDATTRTSLSPRTPVTHSFQDDPLYLAVKLTATTRPPFTRSIEL